MAAEARLLATVVDLNNPLPATGLLVCVSDSAIILPSLLFPDALIFDGYLIVDCFGFLRQADNLQDLHLKVAHRIAEAGQD